MERYGCSSVATGDDGPRSKSSVIWVQVGRESSRVEHCDNLRRTVEVRKPHESTWLPIACGYLGRLSDKLCNNCVNQTK